MTTSVFRTRNTFSRIGALLGAIALVSGLVLVVNTTTAQAAPIFYNDAGSITNYTVPAGIGSVQFDLQGGHGAAGAGDCAGVGGSGAYVYGTIALREGDVLTIVVGQNGSGSQYGGQGGLAGGGNGGDATYLYINGEDRDDIMAVAGAGGGGGASDGDEGNCENFMYGGNGGTAGVSGLNGSSGTAAGDGDGGFPGGNGASTVAEGLGASVGIENQMDGHDGFGFEGGDGGDRYSVPVNPNAGGGGGGEGYYGGGGGGGGLAAGSGGGSGSSYVHGYVTGYTVDVAEGPSPFAALNFNLAEPEPGPTPPNNGDANGDGILDEDQTRVRSVRTNEAQDIWTTIVMPDACDIGWSESIYEETELDAQDTFTYPANFYGFTIGCSQPTVTFNIFYHNLPGNWYDYLPRKFLPYNNTFVTLPGASLQNVTIGGKNVVKLTYSITDGSMYDIDQTVNGQIQDPVSLAYSPGVGLSGASGTLPATGTNPASQTTFAIVLSLVGAGVLGGSRLKRRRGLI